MTDPSTTHQHGERGRVNEVYCAVHGWIGNVDWLRHDHVQHAPLPDPSTTRSEPRTPTGRAILLQDFRGNSAYAITRREILAIESEAAAPPLPAPAPTLDVVRLAAALDNVDRDYERGWTPAHYARAVAAEYARLQPTPRTIR